jgi:hypothetical protein
MINLLKNKFSDLKSKNHLRELINLNTLFVYKENI